MIVPIVYADNKRVVEIKNELLLHGYAVGAIRQPTVSKAIIRLIARLGESLHDLNTFVIYWQKNESIKIRDIL